MATSHGRLYLLYHQLRNSPGTYSYALEKSEFAKHADLFVKMRGRSGPAYEPEITFDDGHISNYDLALPVLSSRGLEATFFITVGWTGTRAGYMGWEELRTLHATRQTIGAHGWTHTLLTHCDNAALQTELVRARLTLEDKLGTAITSMSLPGGRFDRRVLAACRDAGYSQIFSSIPRAEHSISPSLVGRFNVRSSHNTDYMVQLLNPDSGLLRTLERRESWKAGLKRAMGDRMYSKLWGLLNHQKDAGSGEAPPE